jgi:hypothetical protein
MPGERGWEGTLSPGQGVGYRWTTPYKVWSLRSVGGRGEWRACRVDPRVHDRPCQRAARLVCQYCLWAGQTRADVARCCTPRTKAIIPVHLFGQVANLDALLPLARERGIRIVEDCAQAIGASWQGQGLGSAGDIGCFSFYPTKNLGADGDGGMCVTSDAAMAKKLRILRVHGIFGVAWKHVDNNRAVSYCAIGPKIKATKRQSAHRP